MNGDTIGALVMVVIALALVVGCVRRWRQEQRRVDALLAAGLDEREDGES